MECVVSVNQGLVELFSSAASRQLHMTCRTNSCGTQIIQRASENDTLPTAAFSVLLLERIKPLKCGRLACVLQPADETCGELGSSSVGLRVFI